MIECLEDRLTVSDLSNERDSHFIPLKPYNLHFIRLEETLAHQLYCGLHCKSASIEQLVSYLPKQATGKLEPNATYGYGLHGHQGLVFYKIFLAYAVAQAPLWGFAVYWLVKYPGDIQYGYNRLCICWRLLQQLLELQTTILNSVDVRDLRVWRPC